MSWSSLSSNGDDEEEEWEKKERREKEELPSSWEPLFPESVLKLFLFRQMEDHHHHVQELKQAQQVILGTGLLPVCVDGFDRILHTDKPRLSAWFTGNASDLSLLSPDDKISLLYASTRYNFKQFHALTRTLCYEMATTLVSEEGQQALWTELDTLIQNAMTIDDDDEEQYNLWDEEKQQQYRNECLQHLVARGRGTLSNIIQGDDLYIKTYITEQNRVDIANLERCGRIMDTEWDGTHNDGDGFLGSVKGIILLIKLQLSLCFLNDQNYGIKTELAKLTKEEQDILEQHQCLFDHTSFHLLLPYGCVLYNPSPLLSIK